MRVLAIDPGNVQSAYVLAKIEDGLQILDKAILPNHELLELVRSQHIANYCAIEMIASYGMPVGASVFETCVWIGRFTEAWEQSLTTKWRADLVYRKDVKMHLCHSMKAKDSNIRQALIDLYPPTGGGKLPQVGTSKQPGPLHGFSKDKWAALGVAVTYVETRLAA